ncbi:MAG: hypothetical protein IT337_00575 [Thermomicrobiales bacterium]|nr:hypothetical protein [Thermomicrobiales bacterium]
MLLGWYDPDRKRNIRLKLDTAIERYVEKFGASPEVVLTNPVDAVELRTPTRRHPGEIPLAIHEATFVPRWTFYIGDETDIEPVIAA